MVVPLNVARVVLLVIRRETKIEEYLASRKTVVMRVPSCKAAADFLNSGAEIGLVVTEEELPDGDWRVIVDAVRRAGLHTEVLVRHRQADTIDEEAGRVDSRIDLEGNSYAAHGQIAVNATTDVRRQ
jgi:hypothetical protein